MMDSVAVDAEVAVDAKVAVDAEVPVDVAAARAPEETVLKEYKNEWDP